MFTGRFCICTLEPTCSPITGKGLCGGGPFLFFANHMPDPPLFHSLILTLVRSFFVSSSLCHASVLSSLRFLTLLSLPFSSAHGAVEEGRDGGLLPAGAVRGRAAVCAAPQVPQR